MIYISDEERPSYYSADQLIKNEESASIVLNKHVHDKLGNPYNPCVDNVDTINTDLVQRTVRFNTRYSRDKCYYLCFFKYTANKYNCTYDELSEFNYKNMVTILYPFISLFIIYNNLFVFYKSSNITKIKCSDILKGKKRILEEINAFNSTIECSNECPLECDVTYYTYKVNI